MLLSQVDVYPKNMHDGETIEAQVEKSTGRAGGQTLLYKGRCLQRLIC